MYYLVLCAQVGPQIEIKYKQGGKQFIHRASHRWTKFSGDNAHCTCTVHKLCLFWKVLAGTSTSCSHTPSSLETSYPGALKLVSVRVAETLSFPTLPPAGLITAWTQRTWAGMRQEYLSSGEERIELPEISETGQCLSSSNTQHGVPYPLF